MTDQIDRMARSARRHVRYEREKAMKWIEKWRIKPPISGYYYTSKAINALWDARLFSDACDKDYEHPFTREQMNGKVARFAPPRFA